MGDLVFISHSNADKGVADAICAELERAGIRCWIAPRDITPGRMWGEAIIDGINASRVMIVVHSKHSNRSPQVIREVERAVNRRLLLLQVRMADIKPSRALELFIASSQWLNAFPGPVDTYLASLPTLVRTLLTEAVETGEHTAEHSGEHSAEQSEELSTAFSTEYRTPHSAPSNSEGVVGPAVSPAPEQSARPSPAATRKTLSPRVIGSLVAGLSVIVIGSWGITQMNRDKGASASPDTLIIKPAVTSRADSSADSVVKTPVVPDPAPPPLRIAATATRYKVGDRFTLRAEPRGTIALRWRSGNSRVVALSEGDSVFRANAAGSAFVFAESGTQLDSIRIVVERAPVVAVTPPPRPPATSTPNTGSLVAKETTAVTNSKEAPKPSVVTDAVAATKAGECMQAITQHNANWVRAHYGSPLTVEHAANLKALESIFGKREYRAELLTAAKFAGNSVTFSMRVSYQGGFGPRVSVDVPFEVRMAGDEPQGAPEMCRVRGVLKAP